MCRSGTQVARVKALSVGEEYDEPVLYGSLGDIYWMSSDLYIADTDLDGSGEYPQISRNLWIFA